VKGAICKFSHVSQVTTFLFSLHAATTGSLKNQDFVVVLSFVISCLDADNFAILVNGSRFAVINLSFCKHRVIE
jgi:hypothetical protein